jgi:galactitol-specific phosphotransferase system IIB component
LSKLLLLFVRQETGKGLSQNDLTDELTQMILGQFSGSWNDLADRPANVSYWTNDANYQSALQVSSAISTALTASGFQTAAQVEALIEAALATLDTDIFIVVDELPDPGDALPNKIYLVPASDGISGNSLEEWIVVNGKWEKFGAVALSLDGYFNETNLTPITNSEIDAMIASLLP